MKLRDEYAHLTRKFGLTSHLMPVHWKYLRLRPYNFPTVRIAQFAALLHHQPRLFSFILESPSLLQIKKIFRVSPSQYWDYHFMFDKKGARKSKKIGFRSIDTILINAVVPLLFAHGQLHDQPSTIDRALDFLTGTKAESNNLIRIMQQAGFSHTNAHDSQGLLQLYQHFCSQKKCLYCNIGIEILKP
jgi:hypothetical protein